MKTLHKIIFLNRSRLLLITFFAFIFTFCVASTLFAQTCENGVCEPMETLLDCMADCKDAKWAVNHGSIFWDPDIYSGWTQMQTDFVNQYFASVEVGTNSAAIRQTITTELQLYRLINEYHPQGGLNWSHVDANESMFFHCDSSPYYHKRVKTSFNMWLMNGYDFVDPARPDAQDHWINYWATMAAADMNRYGYDTLRIDSATHTLFPWWAQGCWPLNESYSDETYTQARYDALEYTKYLLPDKKVIWNGLHQGNHTWPSLGVTEGGMAEGFVYDFEGISYRGFSVWKYYIDMVEKYKNDKKIHLTSLATTVPDLAQKRQMIMGSYLLVKNPNVRLIVSTEKYDGSPSPYRGTVPFAPEYVINIGDPLRSHYMQGELFRRDFENGFVLVNPYEDKTYSYTLNKEYQSVEGQGVCLVQPDGSTTGCSLSYTPISGEITLPPASAIILINNNPADVNNDTYVNIKDIQACIKVITKSDLTYQDQCQVLAPPPEVTNIKDIQVIIREIIKQ